MRFALAKVFYGALANQQPHKFGDDDLFTLFWERKQRLFGNARAFDEANGVLKWFAVAMKERKGSHARGYQLTNEARVLGESYLKQSLKTRPELLSAAERTIEDDAGRPLRKPVKAIRSKTATGDNCDRFQGTSLNPVVEIDGDALRRFYEVACAWQRNEECLTGWEWLYKVWDELSENPAKYVPRGLESKRVQRAKGQALMMLDVATRFGAPSRYALPTTYVESSQGRLYSEGPITLQGCVRELRRAVLRGCWDCDVENCHWSILSQLAGREAIETPHIKDYLDNKKSFRRQIAADLEICIDDAKSVLIALVYGARLAVPNRRFTGAIEERITAYSMYRAANHRMLLNLQSDVAKARTAVVASPAFTNIKRGYIVNDAGRQLKIAGATANEQLAHILQGAESKILQACMESCSGIVIIQHDGLTTRARIEVDSLSEVVERKTGYRVSFSQDQL
jgi:hypothetical protein